MWPSLPPAARTLPSGRGVAVCPERAVPMLPVGDHPCTAAVAGRAEVRDRAIVGRRIHETRAPMRRRMAVLRSRRSVRPAGWPRGGGRSTPHRASDSAGYVVLPTPSGRPMFPPKPSLGQGSALQDPRADEALRAARAGRVGDTPEWPAVEALAAAL